MIEKREAGVSLDDRDSMIQTFWLPAAAFARRAFASKIGSVSTDQ
jgi:hypothetical protein